MDEEDADAALKGLMGRWYAGRPIMCEFSPVTDFREARCRQFDEGTCNRWVFSWVGTRVMVMGNGRCPEGVKAFLVDHGGDDCLQPDRFGLIWRGGSE